jgi:hypothetical protein
MAFAIRCPDCRQKIPWQKDVPTPDFCPRCGVNIAGPETDDAVVVMPAFLSERTKKVDSVYRDMEAKSVNRAEHAAEMAGVSASEMSALKVTNLRDNMREGDIAALDREASAAEARLKAASPAAVPNFASNGAEMSAGISTGAVAINGQVVQGIEPRAGARTAERTQRLLGR